MSTTLTLLEETIAARITALPVDLYQQGNASARAEAWHEAAVPVDPTFEPESLAHLSFEVLTRSSPVAQGQPGSQHRYRAQGLLRCSSQIDVVFAYRVRPTEQRADYRLAQHAALDIVKAVNALDDTEPGDLIVRPTERFAPAWDPDGPWLLVRVGFQIDHDEEV